ncbi:MAG: TIGR03936 family radical SAM-associated protein [Treponema sp.]|nr:TIGR03936 family radical SAM-associated protein [Treponema sp.]
MIHYVNPLQDFGSALLNIEKPARYTGGEYGIYAKEGILRTAIVFPDLYELGMSNQAFRIIYNGLNRMEDISCDRAFAPAPDFEKLLKETGVPLYGLDTGIALGDTDLLLFTLGYELGITGLLSVLDCSHIALRSMQRNSGDPIVIMGGPCVSNPLPYSFFVDAFWIGEAEAGFFDLAKELLDLKKQGAARSDMLEKIIAHPHIWAPGKTGVKRAIQTEFGSIKQEAAVFPISSIRTVQHHGAVEIMRGCPNGCRFCQAGMWYRPMRQKRADLILEEAEAFIKKGGYREISLSSLSTGDYCHINSLIASLNERYSGRHISFQLPSLRVSGFSLPLLAKVSQVRKSGLTFAVETPREADQLSINKKVTLNEVISIINEAKKYGWRGIKFYFMVGLPLHHDVDTTEEALIADFVLEAGKATGSHFHLNLGTFVPKPHTPYQWASQLDEETAWQKFHQIQDKLKPKGHKVSVHNPFMSLLEGIFSRGTEDSGLLAETAYEQGCRLDAWSDFFQSKKWRKIIEENDSLVKTSFNVRKENDFLPWSVIQSGVGESFLKSEHQCSVSAKTTLPCTENCTHHCGTCITGKGIVKNIIHDEVSAGQDNHDLKFHGTHNEKPGLGISPDVDTFRMLFAFSKTGPAVFVPHLSVIEVFSSAIIRSGLNALYTKGFNPLLKIDFASPAPVGLECSSEIACIDFHEILKREQFIKHLNKFLPNGITVTEAELFIIPGGAKKHSPAALLWGFCYGDDISIPFREEKSYRSSIISENNLFGIIRRGMLAKNPINDEKTDYFELYRKLYPNNCKAK